MSYGKTISEQWLGFLGVLLGVFRLGTMAAGELTDCDTNSFFSVDNNSCAPLPGGANGSSLRICFGHLSRHLNKVEGVRFRR